ncbi:MAG: ABC transporter ATP-binding protein [Pseudolysinimonas sp.]|uniref:ABC transporter ATP-binding protein n=1 Tax=Pseudolysinimonas sp. TaxID=2680009 RepID=UPI003C78CDD3
MSSPVLEFSNVSVVRGGTRILDQVSWAVGADERWVVLGPNGAGKTTLLQIAAATMHPTSGHATLLGERLGKSDVFEMRPRIGLASSAMAKRIPADEVVLDVVLTAAYAVTGRWNEVYEDVDVNRARRVLGEWKLSAFDDRRFGTLSDGEQKRVQIARAVMADPEVLLLDEPAASLDLGSREELLQLLGGFASNPKSPAMVMVTHHVEEIPPGFSHVLLLADGAVTAAGPIGEVLTAGNLTATFGLPIELTSANGRFAARAA